jgi:hypothetical protein
MAGLRSIAEVARHTNVVRTAEARGEARTDRARRALGEAFPADEGPSKVTAYRPVCRLHSTIALLASTIAPTVSAPMTVLAALPEGRAT